MNILAPDHGWQTAGARMMQHPQMLQRVTSGAEVQKGCTNCQANFLQTFKTWKLLNFVNCSATAPSVIEELFWLLQLIWSYFADWYAVLHILPGIATSFHEFTTKKNPKTHEHEKNLYLGMHKKSAPKRSCCLQELLQALRCFQYLYGQ